MTIRIDNNHHFSHDLKTYPPLTATSWTHHMFLFLFSTWKKTFIFFHEKFFRWVAEECEEVTIVLRFPSLLESVSCLKALFPAQFINMKDDWELSCETVFCPHPNALMISPGVRRNGHWGRESGNTKTGVNSFGVRKARARFFRVVGIHLIEIKFRVKSKINSLSAYAVAFNHINQRWGSLNVKLELNALESTNITMLYISSH